MHKTLWAVFASLGVLLWLSNLGVGSHPLYRLSLMAASLSWCGWFAWPTNIGESR
jgi:hypothetical protein